MDSCFFFIGTEVVKSCFSADGDFIPADGVGDPPMISRPEAEPVRRGGKNFEESLLCRFFFKILLMTLPGCAMFCLVV